MNCPQNNPDCTICGDPFVDDWNCLDESRFKMDKLHEEALRMARGYWWDELSQEEKDKINVEAWESSMKWEMEQEAQSSRSFEGFEHVGPEYGSSDWFEEVSPFD